MIIYEDEELVIPSGIGPTVNTESGEVILDRKTVSITKNGTVKVVPGSGYNGISECNIITNVPTQINNQGKEITCQANGNYTVVPDINHTGLDNVKVKVRVPDPLYQTKTVSSTNQTQTVGPDEGFDAINNIIVAPINGQNKVVSPTTQSQTVIADLPYYALSSVIVQAAPTEARTIKSSNSQQVVTPSGNNVGLSSVTVDPYILDDKTVDSSTNSQIITSSEDGLASVTINPYVLDNKTIDSSTVTQVITSDEDGLQSVTINPYVLESKTVNPSWVDQTITPSANKDGLSSVKVNKVTSDIDPNITPNNIKLGVNILGVDGRYDPISGITTESVTVDSSTAAQKVTATSSDYLSEVNIRPYTLDYKTVDASTNDQVVTSDVDGLSSVTVNKAKLQTKSINNYTNETTDISKAGTSVYIYPDTNYLGFNRIWGNYIYTARMTVDASTNDVVYTRRDYFQQPPYNLSSGIADSYTRIKDVKVNKVTAAIDSNIQAGNIKSGVTILGVTGNFQGGDLTTITVDSSINGATYYVPDGYYGFSQFSVEPYVLQDKTVNASTISQRITADNEYNGLGTVTIKPVTASIDSDIKASNIKQGVTILGVNGSVVEADYDAIYARLQAF